MGIILDLGTGDGSFVLEVAKNHPEHLVIGVDPAHKPLVENSSKIYKKSAKGGLPNALFVLAGVEKLPEEIKGQINQVFINFPWGSLLRGVIKAESKIWSQIAGICTTPATIDILTGYSKATDATEMSRLDLPELSLDYLQNDFTTKLENLNLRLKVKFIKTLENFELEGYPTTWCKKLKFNQSRNYFWVRVSKTS